VEPESWRWIWLIVAVVAGAGEIAVAGSFFLAPFAIAAAVAAVLAFLGVSVAVQWVVFLVVAALLLAGLRPLARRLDANSPATASGIGAGRQVGQRARVVEAIDGVGDEGFVMLGAERWRAESADGVPIPEGANVIVTAVRGTRVMVTTTGAADAPDATDPTSPPA
jgi:membrane protein implicated in regulation of membrane protease activity